MPDSAKGCTDAVIDLFSLAITHALLLLAAWRMVGRADLDREPEPAQEPLGDA